MTLTSSIANTSSATTSVSVPRITMSSLVLIGTTKDEKTGVTIGRYRLPSGDTRYPLELQLKIQLVNGVRRCQGTLSSFVKIDDSVSGESAYTPISCGLWVNVPDVLVNLADVAQFVMNTVGVILGTVTTGSPDYKVLSNLLYGVPGIS